MGEIAMNRDRAVYVVLTDTGTWFSRMIGWYTGKQLNHASLAFDAQLEEVYSFGRKQPNNPLSAGFVRENMRSDWFLSRQEVPCAIYECRVNAMALRAIKRFIQDMQLQHMAYGYNLLGLFCVAAGIRYEPNKSYFCSQFVAEALARGGLSVTDKPACLTTPQDLAKSDRLRLVYKGTLRHYLEDVSADKRQAYALDAGVSFPYNRVGTFG